MENSAVNPSEGEKVGESEISKSFEEFESNGSKILKLDIGTGAHFLSAEGDGNAMQTKIAIAILAGFGLGIVVAKVFYQHKPPTVKVVKIPDRDIPHQGPSVREWNRNPDIYGRREIF